MGIAPRGDPVPITRGAGTAGNSGDGQTETPRLLRLLLCGTAGDALPGGEMVLHVIPNGRNTAYWIGKRDHKNQSLRANSHTDSSELGGKGVLLRAATSISACGSSAFTGLRVTDGPAVTGGCRSHPRARWPPRVALGESCLWVTAFNVTRGVSSVCRIGAINPD